MLPTLCLSHPGSLHATEGRQSRDSRLVTQLAVVHTEIPQVLTVLSVIHVLPFASSSMVNTSRAYS